MAKNKPTTFFCKRVKKEFTFPPGLSQHQHKTEGKWRYVNLADPAKLRKDLRNFVEGRPDYITTQEAIDIVINLNEINGVTAPVFKVATGQMHKLVEDFIAREIRFRKPTGKDNTDRFISECQFVRRMAGELSHLPLSTLKEKTLINWWHEEEEFEGAEWIKSDKVQRSMRLIAKKFLSHIMLQECTPIRHNVFNFGSKTESASDVCAGYKAYTGIARGRITMHQFDAIREAAIKGGDQWLANAMDITLATSWREADVVGLQFGEHFDQGVIKKVSEKSKNQRGAENASYKMITLKNRPDMLEIVNRCALTRNQTIQKRSHSSCSTPATHLIHNPTQKMKKNSKSHPIHYSQVSVQHCCNTFREYRDSIPMLLEIPAENRPTFHEIRGLHSAVRKILKHDLKEVSVDMAHKDTKITELYQSGHYKEWEEMNYCLTEEDKQAHLEWEVQNEADMFGKIA